MKKRFIALACLALLAVACSSDSSSNTAGPDESAEAVNSSSDASPASSSDSIDVIVDTVQANADSDEAEVNSADTDEADVDEEEKNVRVKADETKSSSSSRVIALRSSSSKARSKSSSSAVVVPASSSSAKSSSSAAEELGDWRQACLDVINEYRATENLGPLALAPEEKQTCTDEQAAADLAVGKGHANFGACGEFAQNTGPNVNMYSGRTYASIAKMYLKMMWEDEKALVTSGKKDPNKKEDYSDIGHYLNMKGSYKTVSCGFAVSDDGKTGWLNIDFF